MWTLRLPNAEEPSFSELPKSMREVVLLGSLHCDSVSDALKASASSLADPASLTDVFSLVGTAEDTGVRLSSDEDVRCFFSATAKPCTVVLGLRGEEASEPPAVVPVIDFVAARERAKTQESVTLNIGGKLRQVHAMTAERIPLIAAMLRFPRDASTPIFVDASPKAFDVVLELARGRSHSYLDSLEPSLKALVNEYAEYAGMSTVLGFEFRLTATSPTNEAAKNKFGYISQGDAVYTTGVRPQWNTVFGSVQIPQAGSTYWEVEVEILGKVSQEFIVGVVQSSFAHMHNRLDAASTGWGLALLSTGVHVVAERANVSTVTDVFPITEGTRIGVLVDANRGSLMFFHNGTFKLSHPASVEGEPLLPAFSVLADTVLTIKTHLMPPM